MRYGRSLRSHRLPPTLKSLQYTYRPSFHQWSCSHSPSVQLRTVLLSTSSPLRNKELYPPKFPTSDKSQDAAAIQLKHTIALYRQLVRSGGSLLAIDFEGQPDKPTELGYSSRTFSSSDPGFTKDDTHSFIVSSSANPKHNATNQAHPFVFGEMTASTDAAAMTAALGNVIDQLPKPLIVILHGGSSDIATMANHNVNMSSWLHPSTVSLSRLEQGLDVPLVSLADTGILSQVFGGYTMSLEKLAAKLSIRPATLPVGASIKLHNAGNDAHLTLRCFERLLGLTEPTALERSVDKLQISLANAQTMAAECKSELQSLQSETLTGAKEDLAQGRRLIEQANARIKTLEAERSVLGERIAKLSKQADLDKEALKSLQESLELVKRLASSSDAKADEPQSRLHAPDGLAETKAQSTKQAAPEELEATPRAEDQAGSMNQTSKGNGAKAAPAATPKSSASKREYQPRRSLMQKLLSFSRLVSDTSEDMKEKRQTSTLATRPNANITDEMTATFENLAEPTHKNRSDNEAQAHQDEDVEALKEKEKDSETQAESKVEVQQKTPTAAQRARLAGAEVQKQRELEAQKQIQAEAQRKKEARAQRVKAAQAEAQKRKEAKAKAQKERKEAKERRREKAQAKAQKQEAEGFKEPENESDTTKPIT